MTESLYRFILGLERLKKGKFGLLNGDLGNTVFNDYHIKSEPLFLFAGRG